VGDVGQGRNDHRFSVGRPTRERTTSRVQRAGLAEPMADWIPIASLILTPTIVAAYALYQQRREHDHEWEQELRSVLDDAARQATLAKSAVDNLHRLRVEEGATATDEAWTDAKDHLTEMIEGPRHAEDRIAIRLGVESEVAEKYSYLLGRLDEYRRNAIRVVEGEPRPDDPIAIPFLRREVEAAQREFFDAALDRVGLSAERWWSRVRFRIRRR
jgi:hypothetical protein